MFDFGIRNLTKDYFRFDLIAAGHRKGIELRESTEQEDFETNKSNDLREKENIFNMFDLHNMNEFAEVLYGFDLVTTDHRKEVRNDEIGKFESRFKEKIK